MPHWDDPTEVMAAGLLRGMTGCFMGYTVIYRDIPIHPTYIYLLTTDPGVTSFGSFQSIETDTPPVLADVRRETRCWYSPTPRVGASSNHPRYPG
jgi:hypothetical protein